MLYLREGSEGNCEKFLVKIFPMLVPSCRGILIAKTTSMASILNS